MSRNTRRKDLYRYVEPPRFRRTIPLAVIGALIASLLVVVPVFAELSAESDPTTPVVLETESAAYTIEHDGLAGWDDASALSESRYIEYNSLTDYSPVVDYDLGRYAGSMFWITNKVTGASDFWMAGYTGAGIDVALIDTGVVPVDGLRYPGKVINGADLSFESQADNLRYLDTYGHGTHLAGIIAGRDDAASAIVEGDSSVFLGMAPGARIVSVKVADSMGAADVSQVIAAIDWVVEHRTDNGMNIRVLTLAYGTDGVQSYPVDPLALAVERAWHAGIVVVVAAGNDGNDVALRDPAFDPFVIAVGAGVNDGARGITEVAPFSSCGTGERFVDVVAPGRSVVSLRNPGSFADEFYPEARVADRFFLGSGTSQAAAVFSGAVALLLDQRPELTPDQVKQLLTHNTATWIDGASAMCQGAGSLDLSAALDARTPTAPSSAQTYQFSDGSGSLEAARGTNHVYDEGVALEGEIDIMSSPWNGYSCSTIVVRIDKVKTRVFTCDSLWDDGTFNGASWSGASWSGASWSGASWSGALWSGASWSGASWSSKSWSSASWSGASWSGASWSSASWSGASWSGDTWAGLSWN